MDDGGGAASGRLRSGTAAFRRANRAMFAAGFSTFALLYCVQPLLPLYAAAFQVSPAASSLALSLTTGVLAVSMLVASSLSESWGRKPVMLASLVVSAALTLLSAAMPTWGGLLAVRALEGVALSGLPAVAMAYLSEEVDAASIGLAMGLFIGGSAFGGMAGRVLTGFLTGVVSWRAAIAFIGLLGLAASVAFWRNLPPSRHFTPRPLGWRNLGRSMIEHLRDKGLPWLFLTAFLLMGSFVTVYNYMSFRLLDPPYGLDQAAVGAIFMVYLAGIASSAVVGTIAGRLGRRRVLWVMVLLTLAGLAATEAGNLVVIVAGLVVFTFGFFGAHSIASSWVGRRARTAKAQASALYLFCYYLGASVVGSSGGLAWARHGWSGVAALVGALLIAALAVAARLARLPPIHPETPR